MTTSLIQGFKNVNLKLADS